MGRFRLYYKKRKLSIIDTGRKFIHKVGGTYQDYGAMSKSMKTGEKRRYKQYSLLRLSDKKR